MKTKKNAEKKYPKQYLLKKSKRKKDNTVNLLLFVIVLFVSILLFSQIV